MIDMKSKLSFKKQPKPTGRWRSFQLCRGIDIKLDGCFCGWIHSDNPGESPWKISLQVIKADIKEDGNTNCAWKWITFKSEFNEAQQAKDWVREHWESITSKYNVYKEVN